MGLWPGPPEGTKALVFRHSEEGAQSITVVQKWNEELRDREQD